MKQKIPLFVKLSSIRRNEVSFAERLSFGMRFNVLSPSVGSNFRHQADGVTYHQSY